MMRALVLRGALAGAVGGLVAFLFGLVAVEPLIDAAIGYEEGRDAAQDALAVAAGRPVDGGAGTELVSRGVQGTLGLGLGSVLLGVALGLLAAVVYALFHGTVGLRPRILALLVALGGFVTLYATPFVKYPANPPAVGREETVGDRSALYFLLVLASVLFAAVAVVLARRLARRLGTMDATLIGVLAYVVLAGVLMSVLASPGELAANVAQYGPVATETPRPLRDAAGSVVFPGFDPDLLYDFRIASLTAQLLLWGVFGLVFGALVERRTTGPAGPRATAPDPAAVGTPTPS